MKAQADRDFAAAPFLILLLTVLMIITYVPALTMWLPQAVYGN